MSRRLPGLAALFLLVVAGGQVGFVRGTTDVGVPGSGLCLWWGARTIPFKVNATSAATAVCGDAGKAAALAIQSVQAWNHAASGAQPCTDLAFSPAGTTTGQAIGHDGTNLLVFRSGSCDDTTLVRVDDPCRTADLTGTACANKWNCWNPIYGRETIGITTTTFVTATGEIVDADVEFHGWDGKAPLNDGAFLTCASTSAGVCDPPADHPAQDFTACTWIDLGEVVAHEAGHMLGLDHVCTGLYPPAYPPPYDVCPAGNPKPGGGTSDPTMAPSFLPGETARRVLSADDVSGVCTIYPVGQETLTCAPPDAGKKGSGCGQGGDPTALLGLALALGALRLARRSRRS